jgi:hypothetical protein
MSEKLALFDPASYYNRLRACVRTEDKLRGFFHWLTVRDRHAPARGEPAVRPGPLRLVFSAERPEEALPADVQAGFVPDDRGGAAFGLAVQLRQHPGDPPRKKTACRAYLLEQAVLGRLRSADPSLRDAADDILIGKVFHDERVAANWEVARILSALPELEGSLDERGRGDFQPFPLPENCPIRSLPVDVHVVVVLAATVAVEPKKEPETRHPQPAGVKETAPAPGDLGGALPSGTWQWEPTVRELLKYMNGASAPPPPTDVEWECLLTLRQPSPQQGLTPNEVRGRLSRPPNLAVVSDALQTAAEKGYLVEGLRERPPSGTGAAVRTRGGAIGPEPVYRLVPKKVAAALCHGLLAGTVAPSAEVRQALLGLVETLGVPPEVLEQLREG